MRKFTDKEKNILKRIEEARNENKLEKLCLATYVDDFLETVAIEWHNDDEKKDVIIFCKPNIDAQKIFFELCDLLCLFQLLENEGYIFLHRNESLLKERALYDHQKYQKVNDGYANNDYVDISKSGETYIVLGKKLVLDYKYTPLKQLIVPSDIVELLDRYGCAIIHPTPALVQYVKWLYHTPEEIGWIASQITAWIAIAVAIFH